MHQFSATTTVALVEEMLILTFVLFVALGAGMIFSKADTSTTVALVWGDALLVIFALFVALAVEMVINETDV